MGLGISLSEVNDNNCPFIWFEIVAAEPPNGPLLSWACTEFRQYDDLYDPIKRSTWMPQTGSTAEWTVIQEGADYKFVQAGTGTTVWYSDLFDTTGPFAPSSKVAHGPENTGN